MKYINGNILDIDRGYILHQVNCKKVAGAGLALQIKEKYPTWYKLFMMTRPMLGMATLFQVDSELYIVNLFSQFDYGTDKRHTDYGAMESALENFKDFYYNPSIPVYAPYKIGCGLAGGEWPIVRELLGRAFDDITIVKLGEDN